MNEVGRVTHIGIQVSDFERSLRFYRDLLGFEIVEQWVRDDAFVGKLTGCPGVEVHVAKLSLPGGEVLLEIADYRNVPRRPVDPSMANPGMGHFGFEVDNLDALTNRMTAAGVRFLSSPIVVSPGRKAVVMCDPDGFPLELFDAVDA